MNTQIRINRRNIWLFVLPVFLVLSCKHPSERMEKEQIPVNPSEQKLNSDIDQIKKVYYSAPSPAEMLEVIQVAELTFKQGILNPVSGKDRYDNRSAQSLNLGVYLTDLAYTSAFGRHELSVDYLEAAMDLTAELRIDQAIQNSLIEKARNSIQHVDSLFEISNEAFVSLMVYCEKNELMPTLVMISAGAFIESVYIACYYANSIEDAEDIKKHLGDQRYVLQNIFALAESVSEEAPHTGKLLSDLEPMLEWYNGMGQAGGGKTELKKAEGGKLVLGGEAPVVMSAEELGELSRTVRALRTKIVTNQ